MVTRLNESSPTVHPTSQGREARRPQILSALRGEADALRERLAGELADLPDNQGFGTLEHTLRDLSHDCAARAPQAGIDAGKKRGM